MPLALDANLGTVTNSGTLTTSAAAAVGSRVFVFVWWYDSTALCTGATGGGLTWVVDHQFAGTFSGDQNQALLSADAPSGLASSTNIVPTFSDDGPNFGPGIAAVSFTGVATGASGYVDVISADQENFEEAWTTENLVTTNADDLLIAFSLAVAGGSSNTASAPATEVHDWNVEGASFAATEYRIVSSTSTYALSGTWSATVNSQHNFAVAYKAAPTFAVVERSASLSSSAAIAVAGSIAAIVTRSLTFTAVANISVAGGVPPDFVAEFPVGRSPTLSGRSVAAIASSANGRILSSEDPRLEVA